MRHEMTLTEEHEGSEIWECPICGRKYMIDWNPWRKVTLVEGDAFAPHSGSKGISFLGLEVKQ